MRKPIFTTFARDLRRRQTDAERHLWMRIRRRELAAAKFRRQYSIGPYIVDFCCIDHRLIIELDGGQHVENMEADQERSAFLERLGFRVVRFWDNEVLTNTDAVLEAILEQLRAQTPLRSSPEDSHTENPHPPLSLTNKGRGYPK